MSKDQQSSNKAKMICVYQFNYKSGTYVGTHPSIREAERTTKVKGSDISACCRGLIRQAGGFIWVKKASYCEKGMLE